MEFNLFIVVLLLFVGFNVYSFFAKPKDYPKSVLGYRKLLYTIFAVAILVGLLVDELSVSNWPFIVTLATIVIFMDLSMILTPSILKFGTAEFKYAEEIQGVIQNNDRIQTSTLNRVAKMSSIMQELGKYLYEFPVDLDERMKHLEGFLEVYGRPFGLKIELWNLESVSESGQAGVYAIDNKSIRDTVQYIQQMYGFDLGTDREKEITKLSKSAVVIIPAIGFMIVPVFFPDFKVLAVVENKKGDMLEVDSIHITNLIVLYHTLYQN